jgi:hypothetical protein
MSMHQAGYLRQSDQAQLIQAPEPFFTPDFPCRTAEPRRPEQLPWPRNLFGELVSIAELMAQSAPGD